MRYTHYQFTVPQEKLVRVITDTDAYNEADDQFAIVQAALSPKFENVGFIAAHFGVNRVKNSMEASFQELERLFNKMAIPTQELLYHGAVNPLVDRFTPVDSEGARLIIKEALADDPRPLFVTFLGPLTDLASAYLLEPRIAGRLTAIWIGGGAYPAGGIEFNLGNDINAANVVFGSSLTVWQSWNTV
jgi:inosine-uridine nucleoside N-ribohydrolase